jgi:hypothetical protein
MATTKTKTGINNSTVYNLIGKKVKLKVTLATTILTAGELFTVRTVSNVGSQYCTMVFEETMPTYPSGVTVYYTQIEQADPCSLEYIRERRTALKTREKELKRELAELDEAESYLAETNQETASEDEMKIYKTLKVLDKDISPVERAKLLAKILK